MEKPVDPLFLETLAGLSDGVAVFDADANLKTANQAFRVMNSSIRDFLGAGTPFDIILREAENRGCFPDEVCKRLAIVETDLLDGPEEVHHVRSPAGPGRTYLIRINAVSDGGFVLTQTETPEDDTKSETENEVEALLSKVLEACPACLTMSRVGDGQIIYRSPAATALLGMGKNSFSHFSRREDRADFITELLPDARVDDMRVTGVKADGTEFPAAISARLIEYRGEDVVVSNMEDLTGLMAVQAELAQQRSQMFLTEKMSALGELLAGVAHELNNPLSIIVGNTEMLKEDLLGSVHETRVSKLGEAAGRCVKIVRSFLAMARQEPLDPKPTEARRIADIASDAVSGLISGTEIEIRVDLSDDLPALMVDEVQISQVVINLMTNAIHAIDDSKTGNLVSVSASAERGTVAITISDNGPGISEDIVTRIFDPLFTTKEAGKGTGVGLAFCHRVVSAHGGSIRFVRTPETGASFCISLPADS